jgi:molybdopterin/thiamine biosynthesis adenylyltransferase
LGNPAFTPWVIASLTVVEAVKIITGRETSLRHAWLQVDLREMEFERLELHQMQEL